MLPKKQNRQIQLRIILNATNQEVRFLVGIHTAIKTIANMLADELCLDIFRVRILFQESYKPYKLNESKTLNQLNLTQDGSTLYANVESIHTKSLDKVAIGKQPKPQERLQTSQLDLVAFHPGHIEPYEVDGLTIEAICINPKCINYHRHIVFPIGMGTYSLERVQKEIKCQMCPYKDLGINPAVIVKELQFKNCRWTISGHKKARNGNGYFEQSLNRWVRVEGKDTTSFQHIIGQDQWKNVWIEIKKIDRQTQTHPFLMQPDCIEDYYYSYN